MADQKRKAGTILPETKGLIAKESTFLKGELGVITKQDYRKGDVLFTVEGPVQPQRTKYSFAVDLDRHIEPQREDGSSDFGHYLNHSCNPNTVIRIMGKNAHTPYIEVVARRNIKGGTELTFDYASLEYEVTINNYPCKCSTAECRKIIHGFKDLPDHLVEKYEQEGLIPDYLLNIHKNKK